MAEPCHFLPGGRSSRAPSRLPGSRLPLPDSGSLQLRELSGRGRPASLTPILVPQQEALYMKGRELTPQQSQSSVLSLADSHTEFFDACEVLLSASSSENEVREREADSKGRATWGGRGGGQRDPNLQPAAPFPTPGPFSLGTCRVYVAALPVVAVSVSWNCCLRPSSHHLPRNLASDSSS